MVTTETIIGRTVDGTASGNYDGSSQDFTSDPVKAANYYRGRGSLQTVTFDVAGFQGTMHLEGTLDHAPENAVWFKTFDYNPGGAPITDRYPETVIGNFTWMRVRVTGFAAGTINFVKIDY
jgi:hypothetical protein